MTSQPEFATPNNRPVTGEVAMLLDATGAPHAAQAGSIKHVVAAAGTNAASVKNSSGRVVGWCFANTTAAWKYVRLYNLAVAPTVGSSTVAQTIGVPPNGVNVALSGVGIGFATGIALAVTGGAADADTTATAANDVVGDLFFA